MKQISPNRPNTRFRVAAASITIFTISLLASVEYCTFLFPPPHTPVIRDYSQEAVAQRHGPAQKIISETSIAFYTIVGASQDLKGQADLRGKFWEFQLNDFTGKYSLHYLSDGPLETNGIKFMVLHPHNLSQFGDRQFCIRTPETWKHFVKYNSDKKWYFRGTHDTFVNLTALSRIIDKLEAKGDPMKTALFAFNFHEYNHVYYPHGGTGWLMSNFAIQRFYEKMDKFIYMCGGSADDVAMTPFMAELGYDVMDSQTNQFIVTFPNQQLDLIFEKRFNEIPKCPKEYHLYFGSKGLKPCPVRTAASLHMHRVPMDQAYEVIRRTPENIAVTFPDPNTPVFCKLEE